VTNAGTPAVSDPGVFLVAGALKQDPGFSCSGASCSDLSPFRFRDEGGHFLFAGFLPPFGKRRKEWRP